MNYIEHSNTLGIDTKEIPCDLGKGAPSTSTEGAVGCFYMDTDTGTVYKCTSAENNVYTWEIAESKDAGIYVGYEQPTDPNVNIWFNPNGGVGNSDETNTPSDVSGIVGLALNEMLNNTVARYETIEDALAGTNATSDGKVLAYTCGGALNIMLLDDIASATTINITKDCTLHLNGKTLSFTAMGAKLNITTASEVTINGRVSGSEITKNITNTDGNTERLVSATNTKLSIIGGTYSMYGSYSKMAIVIATENTSTDCEMTECTVIVDVSATNARCAQVQGVTIIDNCSLTAINQTRDVVGVTTSSSTESLTIKNTKAIGKSYGMGSSVRVFNPQAKATTIENCHVEADGYSDCDTDGDGTVDVVNVYAIFTPKPITINGGYYWGARDAIAVGIARINGGVFEGCQHGGAYMQGSDIKAKNAIFRCVKYNGTVGWLEDQNYGGAVYCGNSENNDVNVYFDNCRFESNCPATSGIVAKNTNTEAFLSNCVFDGNFTYDLRADKTCTIYVGKNVAYKTVGKPTNPEDAVSYHGTIDTTTYADQEFGFETETTVSNALLSVKDERGNWVGIPASTTSGMTNSGGNQDADAVTYAPQNKTEEEKAQARANIGATEAVKETSEMYFDITDDGVISLKPEYRGAAPTSQYSGGVSDNGVNKVGSLHSELPEVIVIPEVVNEIAVTALADGMFFYNKVVKSVTIPNVITKIPAYFANTASNLQELNGTENVKILGRRALASSALKKANFPNLETLEVTSKGVGGQFEFCVYLISANLGKVTAIPENVFQCCEMLSCVYNADGVVTVGANAFGFTKRLKSLSFLPNVTKVGNRAFYNSRVDFDWASLSGCDFGTEATYLQYNSHLADFWSGCTTTPCNTPLRSLFDLRNPLWTNETVGDTTRKYSAGCMATCAAMVYSAFEEKDLASPLGFEDAVKAVNPNLMSLDTGYVENLKQWLEAVGYTCEHKTPYNADTLQYMYDALANGAMAIASVDDGTVGDNELHAVLFHGVNDSGELLVVDPASLRGPYHGDYTAVPYAMRFQNHPQDTTNTGVLIVSKN